jgi:hypothetical protein
VELGYGLAYKAVVAVLPMICGDEIIHHYIVSVLRVLVPIADSITDTQRVVVFGFVIGPNGNLHWIVPRGQVKPTRRYSYRYEARSSVQLALSLATAVVAAC